MDIYRYFSNHTLQSNKLNDFKVWRQCLILVLDNHHKTTFGRQLCINLRDYLKTIR